MTPPGRILADPERERLDTPATFVTLVRTVASVTLAAIAASQGSKTLLVVALVVHWVGDSLDGWVARLRGCLLRRPGLAGAAPRTRDLRLPRHVHGGRLLPVARLPGLADHQPQLLLRHRPEAVAAQLVAPRQGRQLRPVRDPAPGHGVDVARARDRTRVAGRQELVAGPPGPDRDAGPARAARGHRGRGGHGEPHPAVKLVLTTLVVAFGSALLPFVNIEAYLAAV